MRSNESRSSSSSSSSRSSTAKGARVGAGGSSGGSWGMRDRRALSRSRSMVVSWRARWTGEGARACPTRAEAVALALALCCSDDDSDDKESTLEQARGEQSRSHNEELLCKSLAPLSPTSTRAATTRQRLGGARLLRARGSTRVSETVPSRERGESARGQGTHLGGDLDVARVDGLDDIVRRAAVDGAADRLASAEDLLDAVGERRREGLLDVAHGARDVNDAAGEGEGQFVLLEWAQKGEGERDARVKLNVAGVLDVLLLLAVTGRLCAARGEGASVQGPVHDPGHDLLATARSGTARELVDAPLSARMTSDDADGTTETAA